MDLMNYPLFVLALAFVVQFLSAQMDDVLRNRVRTSKEEERDDFGVVLGASYPDGAAYRLQLPHSRQPV